MRSIFAVFLAVCLVLLPLTACGQEDAAGEAQDSQELDTPVLKADPQAAIDEIYADIDIKEITTADDTFMTETLGFDLWGIDEYYVRYSSGRYGLADVYIIKPFDEDYDTVRENLEALKLDRVRKTENYDILGSYKIAQNAEIFQYGSYLIMLMLEDNGRAAEIIQHYIPSNETDDVE